MGKKMSAPECQRIWDEALTAGKAAAEERFAKLQNDGPAWNVVDGQEQVVGQMLDLCGFAWVRIVFTNRNPMRKFVAYLKGIGVGDKSLQGGYMLWGSWVLGGQETSPKEHGMKAIAEVLRDNGIECTNGSRVD